MARLFVAVDLPDSVKAQLIRIQPGAQPGMKRVAIEHLHLTLHFLGEADVERVAAALDTVELAPFRVNVSGVGRFSGARRGSTLWAGLDATEPLARLHADIGRPLARTGFVPEARAFSPHVTLARCDARVPDGVVREFLEAHRHLRIVDIPLEEFTLYSSVLGPVGPTHRRERTYGARA